MRFPQLAERLFVALVTRVALVREPDFVVGADNPDGGYLHRWYLTPWRKTLSAARERCEQAPTWTNRLVVWLLGRLPNAYLHHFLRDDDDRALHDHPWWSLSLMLSGSAIEHTIADGGIHRRRTITAGELRLRSPRSAHRIELPLYWATITRPLESQRVGAPISCWTLFITGPVVRRWGFHCPQRGWVDFARFTKPGATGETGAGCEG